MPEGALLLVDDDAPIRRMLERTLTAEGYDVVAAADGGAALAAVERNVPDAIVLDVTMPGIDGLAVTRRLRAKGLRVPILLLTARDAVHERIAGLDAGADDYLVKPFDVDELSARVRAMLRRNAPVAAEQLAFADLTLELETGAARRAGKELELTRREAELLALLLRNARAVVTRELALEEVWGGEGEVTMNAVDRYVAYLRRKLGEPPLIHTVRGIGFRLDRGVTLRRRVAVAAAAAIVLAVALLVIAVPKFLESELQGTLEDTLVRRAADVARLNATAPGQVTAPGALEGSLGGSALYVQVVDKSGRIVARSSGLGGRVIEAGNAADRALRDRAASFADGALGTDRLRIYAAPLGELGQGEASGGAVIVAGSLADIEQTLDHTRRLVALCALVAAALAAALATLLTRRALRPLTRLSSGARDIARSGDVAERLPESPTNDEVAELAATLNAMLASLERAREAEHRFVGDASHELRTPLTALRGNAAYIARHGADPAVLADISAGAERLSELLDDLLALAREDAAAPARGEPVALSELAVGADAVIVEHEVTAEVERAAFARAVDNLVRNARKHGRGRVTITVGGSDGVAFIRIEDEGPGPSERERLQIFERFARGDTAQGEGSGLGLAIVKAIAERHGGRVTVEGSKFTLSVKRR